jgi:ABC-type phosphate transport system substrate-binding protein
MKLRLVLGAGLALALALPAAASATTLIGSGSVAAQPVLLALFNGYHKVHKDINFVYTAAASSPARHAHRCQATPGRPTSRATSTVSASW